MHWPSKHPRPGSQSHAVLHRLAASGTHTCTAQSLQKGQLGTQVHVEPGGHIGGIGNSAPGDRTW